MSYARNAASALALIKRKGVKLPIRRKGVDAEFDPVAGSYTEAGTDTTGELWCVILPYNQAGVQQLAGSISGDNADSSPGVRAKMRKVLAAALGSPFVPDSEDIITFDEADWEVLGCNPLNPDGATNIIFDMTIRLK